MSGSTLVVLELLLVFGLVIGFGIRELLILRRYRRRPPTQPHASDEINRDDR